MKKQSPHAVAPELETERLLLRGHNADDLEHVHAIWSEPAVYKFTVGRPSTREESWFRILRYIGHWTALGFGYWAAIEKSSGELLGDIGIAECHRNMTPQIAGLPEFGWILKTSSHSKGFAAEALTAIDIWAAENIKAKPTCCIISPGNAPSIALANKFGFKYAETASYVNEDILIFKR